MIEVGINDDVMEVIKKIRGSGLNEIVLNIEENSVLFENALNLKLIKKECEKAGKVVTFETEDEVGKNLIELLDPVEVQRIDEETGFISQSVAPFSNPVTSILPTKEKFKIKLPAFKLLKSTGGKKKIILLIPILILVGLIYFVFWKLPKADVSLVVSSQPLVKSVTIKLSSNKFATDPTGRTLYGEAISATASAQALSATTTGQKIVGDKASGTVTLFNKTTEEKKIKKGAILTLVTSKEALKFVMDADIVVPAKVVTPATATEPEVVEFGKKDGDVAAFDVGSKYNLEDDRNFKIDGLDTDDFIASNTDKFSGGTSKTIKAVAQTDIDTLSASAFTDSKKSALASLKGKLGSSQKLIESTVVYAKVSETFDKKIGDTADTLTITQSVSAKGITYKDADLKTLLDTLLLEFIPDGFELSAKDKSIEVGVLDNTTGLTDIASINLQVQIKAFIVPKLDEEQMRADLQGVSLEAGKAYLSGIKNIESYTIELSPKFTSFMNRFPTDLARITISFTKD